MHDQRGSCSYLPFVLLLTASLAGCSSSSGGPNNPNGGGGTGPIFNDGGSSGDSSVPSAGLLDGVDGRGPATGGNVTTVAPVLPGAECAGEQFDGEAIPLEIYIMMDRSISMGDSQPNYVLPGGGTKWDAVRRGFQNFFALPQVKTMSAGIDFFSQNSCDPNVYSTPEVEIGPVPQTAPNILASYDAHAPGDNTPMGPALEGALMHARDWKQAHLGVEVAVVLVTDGVPNGCGTMTSDPRGGADTIAPIAAQYASGTPPVPTYVLGIQGIEVSAADFTYVVTHIAQAGGSEPVIVQATDDLAQTFAAALDKIRAAAAPPCTYSVPLPPAGGNLDLKRVNVVLEPVGSGAEPILNVQDASQCQYGGWYYDPPADPQTINLCPNTCDVVSKLNGAGFKVLFGCATVGQLR
jgi:hypothetical protein